MLVILVQDILIGVVIDNEILGLLNLSLLMSRLNLTYHNIWGFYVW